MKSDTIKHTRTKNSGLNQLYFLILVSIITIAMESPALTDFNQQHYFREPRQILLSNENSIPENHHHFLLHLVTHKKQKTNLLFGHNLLSGIIHKPYASTDNIKFNESILKKIISTYKEFKINLNKHWAIKEEGIVFQKGKKMRILID